MDTLEHRIIIVPKRGGLREKNAAKEPGQQKFPSARYFQIHFQHIESQLELTYQKLDALQQQTAELQARLNTGQMEAERTEK